MIEVMGVSKVFTRKGRSFEALRDVTFGVGTGRFISLIGPSGCGKTTLLKMMAGLSKPTRGTIEIGGKEVTGSGPDRALVFQNFVLLPWADVLTNAAFGLEARGMPKKAREEITRNQLERVGLGGFERHYPHELSGGMQQRVGIARALAVDPDTLLMDEPFGSLDAITRHVMQHDLLRLWQESATKTTVFVTHSMEEAALLSDQVVVMDTRPGRVARLVDVPFPRPRDEGLTDSRDYLEFTAELSHQLEQMQRIDMARAVEAEADRGGGD
ncbi:MAG TPA: ABC transporter ATP-binding protein [Acidimicrobiia bacterium]|nr:ABC transporter ATP-binding protein [Acidimicrobiia bacterium]